MYCRQRNVNLATLGFAEENVKKYQAIITPIDMSGERLGTLFIYKSDEQYDIDDIILSEYGTTVVGLEMMRSVNEENAEETRKIQIVKSAISTLSFSELEAITHISMNWKATRESGCKQDCRQSGNYKIRNRKRAAQV